MKLHWIIWHYDWLTQFWKVILPDNHFHSFASLMKMLGKIENFILNCFIKHTKLEHALSVRLNFTSKAIDYLNEFECHNGNCVQRLICGKFVYEI